MINNNFRGLRLSLKDDASACEAEKQDSLGTLNPSDSTPNTQPEASSLINIYDSMIVPVDRQDNSRNLKTQSYTRKTDTRQEANSAQHQNSVFFKSGNRKGSKFVKKTYSKYENNQPNEADVDWFSKKKYDISVLRRMPIKQLTEEAHRLGSENVYRMARDDIICKILMSLSEDQEIGLYDVGMLDMINADTGFLRFKENNYSPCSDDIRVPSFIVKSLSLRTGDMIEGYVKSPQRNEKYFSMASVVSVNGMGLEDFKKAANFDNLTPLFPKEKLNLGVKQKNSDFSTRIVDLFCPIGKGQRALVVAPPRTGKTILLKNIAHSILENNKEVYLIILLIDERPEEVTDMMRSVDCEVISSTFDEHPSKHIAVAEKVLSKAKRMVEAKVDVVILLDSITRLSRAYNATTPSSGRVLTGGVDANALQQPKRIFGAARNVEEGGSLTIIATALIDTGSKADDVTFEEFKGTGNCEIVLDRKIADKRIYPAIDIAKSGTRKEEEIEGVDELKRKWMFRNLVMHYGNNVSSGFGGDMYEFLFKQLKSTSSNEELLEKMNKGISGKSN